MHLLALLCLLIVTFTTLLPGFSDGPLPQLTGGFQEETCHSCHNSFPLNEGRTRDTSPAILSETPGARLSSISIAQSETTSRQRSPRLPLPPLSET